MGNATHPDPITANRYIHVAVGSALVGQGFEVDSETGILGRCRSPQIDHWVWLPIDVSHDGGTLTITANVAVFCGKLADALRRDHPADASRLATLTRHIGQLMPGRRWHEWTLASGQPAESTAREIVSAIERVGLPWLDTFTTLADLRRGMMESGHRDHRTISVPALDALLGPTRPRRAKARRRRRAPAARAAQPLAGSLAPPAQVDRSEGDTLWVCDD